MNYEKECGFGYSHMDVPRYISWDDNIQRRSLSSVIEESINLYYYPSGNTELVEELTQAFKKVYYIQLPFTDTVDIEELLEESVSQPSFVIEHKGWSLSAYLLS